MADTRLEELMELLQISGKEMSIAAGTDVTTVSKWKKGQRKMKSSSDYAKKISHYVLSEKFYIYRNKIEELLKRDSYHSGKIEDLLSAWLAENCPVYRKESGRIEVFESIEGWMKANREFWNAVQEQELESTIYIGDFGDIKWDQLSKETAQYIARNCEMLLKRGCHIVIIDQITNQYKPYETILRWMAIYLARNVEVLYYQIGQEEFYKQSIYAVENVAAMVGCRIAEEHGKQLTTFYTEPKSVIFYAELVQSIARKSRKLIETSEISDPIKMIHIMEETLKPGNLTYMINDLPSYRNMSIDLLNEILDNNHVEPFIKKRCLHANKARKKFRTQFNYRQIYDLDSIEEALQQEYIVEYDLSRVAGRKIIITKEQFRRQLEEISKTVTTSQYTMVLASYKNLRLNVHDGTSIVVQDDSVVIAWNAKYYELRMHSTELTLVGGYCNYLKEIWNQIPPIAKNDSWTKKQFARMLSDKQD